MGSEILAHLGYELCGLDCVNLTCEDSHWLSSFCLTQKEEQIIVTFSCWSLYVPYCHLLNQIAGRIVVFAILRESDVLAVRTKAFSGPSSSSIFHAFPLPCL